jgi:hypothetical protein
VLLAHRLSLARISWVIGHTSSKGCVCRFRVYSPECVEGGFSEVERDSSSRMPERQKVQPSPLPNRLSDATLKASFGKEVFELCLGRRAEKHPLAANHYVGPASKKRNETPIDWP